MNTRRIIHSPLISFLLALILSIPMFGCGAGSYGSGGNGDGNGNSGGTGGASVVSMQGPWEIVFTSTVSPTKYAVWKQT